MNIAHLLPYSASFPLKKHNGRYEWALRLARLQVTDGHKVTVYCGPSSDKDSNILWASLNDEMPIGKQANTALFEKAFSNSDHDVYHSHFDELHFSLGEQTERPIVVTQHWFPNKKIAKAAQQYKASNIHTIPVTKYMKDTNDQLKIKSDKIIFHGIDLSLFDTTNQLKTDRLLFVGRISEQKGLLETVKLVSQYGEKLDIIGKINEKDMAYWKQIEPYVDNQKIQYLGPKSQVDVAKSMASARAFLFLPAQKEAFGQTIIEAQACGTPVILNDLGANRELIELGKTGFLVHDHSDFPKALVKLSEIKGEDCRSFASKFDVKVMAKAYADLYSNLMGSDEIHQ